jgi:hypothetical protein
VYVISESFELTHDLVKMSILSVHVRPILALYNTSRDISKWAIDLLVKVEATQMSGFLENKVPDMHINQGTSIFLKYYNSGLTELSCMYVCFL